MAQRAWTLSTEEDAHFMLKPAYPLADVIDEFQRGAALRVTTLRTYRSLQGLFCEYLRAADIASPTVADLTHEHALAFSHNFRPKDKQAGRYRERNAIIALKALSNWLAEQRLWYEPRGGDCLSILRDVKLPPIPSLGRKPFTDREVKALLEAIPKISKFPLRERAIMTVQCSAPIRPDEVRMLLLRDFHESDRKRNEQASLTVRASKTEAGCDRLIPLDEAPEDAIRKYLRFERPALADGQPSEFNGDEPIFLTNAGTGFEYNGWTKRNQLLRRDLEKAGIRDFIQYRSRGYAAKRLQKAGAPLQVIMQVGGWKREAMPTRYIGKYDQSELRAFPTADLKSLLRGA
jgi:site-specific recombinase XerD